MAARAWVAALGAALLLAPAVRADDPARALLDRGLDLYEAGDYDGAVDAFQKVLDTGVDDPVVHYDLGNARFKQGRLGFAIWHYRRALELAPRDEDIRSNLDYARFLALDSIEQQAATDTKVRDWLDRVTADEMARLTSLLWIVAAAAFVAWRTGFGPAALWRRLGSGVLVVWAASLTVTAVVWHRVENLDEGVVLAREATVHNGPGDAFDTAFVLHEGAEVVLEGERGSWTEVSLPGELRGWIPTDAIGRL